MSTPHDEQDGRDDSDDDGVARFEADDSAGAYSGTGGDLGGDAGGEPVAPGGAHKKDVPDEEKIDLDEEFAAPDPDHQPGQGADDEVAGFQNEDPTP